MIVNQSFIVFICVCQFSFSIADKLPEDNGRMEVAKCLGNIFSWKTNPFEPIEEHLFKFCNNSVLNQLHIQKTLEEEKLTPDEGMEKMRSCLGDRAEPLITRYKNALLIDSTESERTPPESPKYKNSSPIDTKEPEGTPIKLPENSNSSSIDTKKTEDTPELPEYKSSSSIATKEPEVSPENENKNSLPIDTKKLEGTQKLPENTNFSSIDTKKPEDTSKLPEYKNSSPIPTKEPERLPENENKNSLPIDTKKLEGTPKLPENTNSSPIGTTKQEDTSNLPQYSNSSTEESEGTPELPEFNEMVLGLCGTKEFVEFDELSDEEKPKSIVCLRRCAASLFGKFVAMYKIFKDNYDKMVESNKIKPLMQIDIPEQTDINNKDATGETKELDLTKLTPRTFGLRRTVAGFVNECKNKIKSDKSLLNVVGGKYAKIFIDDVDKLYEICPYKEEKGKLYLSIESYFACVRWTCTMKKEKDIPFRNLLEKVIDRISDDENDLVKNFSSEESVQEDADEQ